MSADSADAMRLIMMTVAEQYAPMHELIAGEVAYFQRQGFTDEQARAMAAAEFVATFGSRIEGTATRENDEGPQP